MNSVFLRPDPVPPVVKGNRLDPYPFFPWFRAVFPVR